MYVDSRGCYVETCLSFWQLNKAYNFEKKKKKKVFGYYFVSVI